MSILGKFWAHFIKIVISHPDLKTIKIFLIHCIFILGIQNLVFQFFLKMWKFVGWFDEKYYSGHRQLVFTFPKSFLKKNNFFWNFSKKFFENFIKSFLIGRHSYFEMWNYGIIHLSVFLEFLKKIFSISVMCKMNTQQIQKKIILLKSAHRVQYVVKWAHGVPKIDTP